MDERERQRAAEAMAAQADAHERTRRLRAERNAALDRAIEREAEMLVANYQQHHRGEESWPADQGPGESWLVEL
jgi:hypothetical protein